MRQPTGSNNTMCRYSLRLSLWIRTARSLSPDYKLHLSCSMFCAIQRGQEVRSEFQKLCLNVIPAQSPHDPTMACTVLAVSKVCKAQSSDVGEGVAAHVEGSIHQQPAAAQQHMGFGVEVSDIWI